VSGNEIILAGYGRLPENTSAVAVSQVLALVVLLDPDTKRIIDASTTLGTAVANSQIKAIFIGQHLIEDADKIQGWIQASYFGSAKKAILASFRDLVNSCQEVLHG
jgi:hypothetical protein